MKATATTLGEPPPVKRLSQRCDMRSRFSVVVPGDTDAFPSAKIGSRSSVGVLSDLLTSR